MRAVAKIDAKQIEEMELDITFRMRVCEWRSLMRAQEGTWPSCSVSRQIAAVLGHITKSTEKTFTDPLHETDKG
jgi:hypothetical protein